MSHLRSVLSKHIPDTHKPRKSTQPTKPHTPPPQKSCSSPTRTTSSPPHDPPFNLPNPYPLHLARNSQNPQLKNTYPAPRQNPKTKHFHYLKNHSSSHPTIYTSPSFCSTSFASNRLHSLTPYANPHSHQLLHLLHTRLHPALNTFPSLTSTNLLNLLLCPNFTPRFRPFYLTSTHKHTTRKTSITPP